MDTTNGDEQKAASPGSGDKAEDSSPSGFRAIPNFTAKADEEDIIHRTPDSSSVSSVNPDILNDEIIVGSHNNADKPSPLRVVSDAEDGDAADGEDEEPISHYPKRKRAPVYDGAVEDKMDISMTEDTNEVNMPRGGSQGKMSISSPRESKGVVIGHWRDSNVPRPEGRHAVIGFMDVRDRLRTRIQHTTRSGEPVNTRMFPIPPGPGGSWVTFGGIVFDDHLIGLDHNEIKEYVKIRSEAPANETPEAREEAERLAVKEARRRLELAPPPETTQPPSIAYGADLPEHAQIGRNDSKRRRLNGSSVVPERPAQHSPAQVHTPSNTAHAAIPPGQTSSPHPGMLDSLPGTRPTRILVGCWSKSAVDDDRERHAVYGILGANDMFRVKLVRETLDGRYVDGNFPAGAGALWIPYEEVIFLRHIAHLSRAEVKEYVRVRQSQIDSGEKEDEKVANETKAVFEAQTRVAHISRGQGPPGNAIPRQAMAPEREDTQDHISAPLNPGGHELRHNRREVMPRNEAHIPRHPLPEPDMRHLARPQTMDPVDRVQGLASREVARMEAVQLRHDRQHQNRFPMGNPNPMEQAEHHRHHFQENRDRMQKIWASQEQNRIRAGVEDAKMHLGIKYERKQNGPFSGKLVSQGNIITIDGEDYVEYRVLTKPSFF
ncbi:hypothetical protein F4777DRAFT_436171 [Nemania sp. FL0916]|nr:hypothetical protein F4777DRAFT_436171 [Nemania sp. FL0916]